MVGERRSQSLPFSWTWNGLNLNCLNFDDGTLAWLHHDYF